MTDARPFHFKHFSLYHHRSTMKVGTDAILLGRWTEVQPTDIVLDIGTGCGLLPLMLSQKGVAQVDAVDIDKASIEEANCPDKICVNHRAIHYSGDSVVCLPHKLTVTVVGGQEDEIDASTN